MPLVKRYPNRKLYDTEARRYVTLDDLAGMIRAGREVQVLDHATGDDLTALTLAQIIAGQEKRRAGLLPHTLLAGLIGAGSDSLRHSLAATLDLARRVDDEIDWRVQSLVRRGDLAVEEALRLRELLVDRAPHGSAPRPGDADIVRALEKRGIPTRQEVQTLLERLNALEASLEALGAAAG